MNFPNRLAVFLVLASAILFLSYSFSPDLLGRSNNERTKQLKLIATTGQIHSALQAITKGSNAELKLLCGPGVDPHSFNASTNDVQAMMDADLIIYNGFHLEAKLDEHLHDTFQNRSWAMADAFPPTGRIDWLEDGEINPDAPFDPHIWNDLPGWSQAVAALVEKLSEVDPRNADNYQANGSNYINELTETHQWASAKLQQLPEDRRDHR